MLESARRCSFIVVVTVAVVVYFLGRMVLSKGQEFPA